MAIIGGGGEPTPRFQRTLPQELWEDIPKRLQLNHLDLVRFWSMYNSWRSVLPSPFLTSIFPLRIRPPPTVSKIYQSYQFFIAETNGYLYGSPPSCSTKNPVIVVFESILPSGSFYPSLLYPMNDKCDRIENFPKVLDLQECWIRSLFTAYCVRVLRPTTLKNHVDNIIREEITGIDKVVLILYDTITNKSIICNLVYTRIRPEVDLCVVALAKSGELYFLSTRSMNWELIKCENTIDSKFHDIINYGGMLWATDKIGGAYVLDDVKSLVLTQTVGSQLHKETSKRCLIEASGDLYMLSKIRSIRRSIKMRIEVYRMKGREWVNVKGIGNHIFYVMKGLCFSTVAGRELCLTKIEGSKEKGNLVFWDKRSFVGEYNFFDSSYDAYSRRLEN